MGNALAPSCSFQRNRRSKAIPVGTSEKYLHIAHEKKSAFGRTHGWAVGSADGLRVGLVVGDVEGLSVGLSVGLTVGLSVGLLVGLLVGLAVRTTASVTLAVPHRPRSSHASYAHESSPTNGAAGAS